MLDALALAATARPDPADLREALDHAYRGIQADPGLAERITRSLLSALRAFGNLVGRALSHDRVSIGATIAAWAVVAALVFLAVRALLRLRLVPDRLMRSAREHEVGVDWHARADTALRAGDHREAVRALYRALLAALNRRGIVHDAPSLTAGECRRVARRMRPELAPPIDRATGIYERVTYGLDDPGDHDLQHMREAERVVLAR